MKSIFLTSSFGLLLGSLFSLGLNSQSVYAQTPNNPPNNPPMSCPCCKDMMSNMMPNHPMPGNNQQTPTTPKK
jgi:hypothetical protein